MNVDEQARHRDERDRNRMAIRKLERSMAAEERALERTLRASPTTVIIPRERSGVTAR